MKYKAPFGSLDPNAPYVDRNVPGAVVGSKIPADFPNWVMREIVDVIEKSGFTPDDVLQLAAAIQGGKMNYAPAAGTANALTAVLTPAPSAYGAGLSARIRITTTNTGAATLNINGVGARAIHTMGGAALAPGDLVAGAIMEFIYDPVSDTFVVAGLSKGIGPYAIGRILTITASQTYNTPAGCRALYVKLIGGGGGGGGAGGPGSGQLYCGSGGASGGKAEKLIVGPLTSYAVTIGAGGTTSATSGGNGGTTSFGAACSATGGAGGVRFTGGTGAGASSIAGAGTGGDINGAGQPGGRGICLSSSAGWGGIGGATEYGGGGYGSGTAGVNGGAGVGFGAGGGGGVDSNNAGGATTGGVGADGVVVVTEYY